MTENDKKFVKSIVEYKSNVANVQRYIKEAYNVDSQFDEEQGVLYIHSQGINESLSIAAAKKYVDGIIDETLLEVVEK